MLRKICALVAVIALVGCATPQQNAALVGGIAGAAIGAAVTAPQPRYYSAPPVYYAPPPVIRYHPAPPIYYRPVPRYYYHRPY